MRRGIDDSPQSRDNFFRILDGAYARGIAAATVHGRTVAQKYVGPSDWNFLWEVKRHAGSRIVLGSGDLFTAHDCIAMLRQTGVDGVSVARGAIGNPWIFRQARSLAAGEPAVIPDLAEQRRILEMQCQLCAEIGDGARVLPTMRMFGIQFARLHFRHSDVRQSFAITRNMAEWQRVLERWYGDGVEGTAL